MFFHHQKNNMKNKIPTILLVGVGRFGERHLETLKMLENKKKLSIAGAVVATTKTQKRIAQKYNIPVWTEITDELLKQVDAVDIVTPPETHFEIAMKCLPFVDVMIEKPMAMTIEECDEIEKVVNKSGIKLHVGFRLRFAVFGRE